MRIKIWQKEQDSIRWIDVTFRHQKQSLQTNEVEKGLTI